MSIYFIQILIKLKNASLINKESLFLKSSIHLLSLIKFLYKFYVIQAFVFLKKQNSIQVLFKSYLNKIIFNNLCFVSKPSHDKFITFKNLCRLQVQPKTSFIVSTDKGFVSEQNCKKFKKGGKLLFSY